jgi:hypothetical protein
LGRSKTGIVGQPRQAGVVADISVERRRCGTKSNFAEMRYSQVNPLKIKDKDLPQVSVISESGFIRALRTANKLLSENRSGKKERFQKPFARNMKLGT